MQHHGAPTRLMDWTYSPYVAAFFAFDELLLQMSTLTTEQQSAFPDKATVWALNTSWLNSKLREKLPSATYETLCEKKTQPDQFERILTESPFTRFICTANPMVLNQRLSLQQGVFLCPGDVTRSWQENLDELDWSPSAAISRRLTLNLETTEAFKHLHRMNVTARSLFPGLDGYGKFIFGRAKLLLDLELMGE
jgi:hypothetical protein